jgi:hypothetical protein
MVGLSHPVLARTRLGVELDQHQRAHSASCAAVMAWISASWWYILSNPETLSGGDVLRGLAAVASVWPPRGWLGEPLPCPKLEWRQSPPS